MDNASSPQSFPPMPSNLATTPPVIQQAPFAGQSNAGNSGMTGIPIPKILTGIIPIFVLALTGLISYSIVNNKQQKATFQSSAAEPSSAQQQTLKNTTKSSALFLSEASVSGCIFSLRYDASSESATLKEEAKMEMEKIKARLEKGEKGEDVLFEVLNGRTQIENNALNKERLTNRTSYLEKLKSTVNSYLKFSTGNSPNFCFQNTKEINEKLTLYFYQLNPIFQTNFTMAKAMKISDPFQIYKSVASGKIDYGWMIINQN